MTQEAIQRQIEILKEFDVKLAKDPELGRQFLIKIGLLMKEETPPEKKRAKKRTK